MRGEVQVDQGIANLLNINRIGSGDRTLVLCHGFGTDQTAWAAQVEALSQDYRLVLFDLPGCGGARKAAYDQHRHSTLHGYADDLIHLCDELGVEDAIYVGHSVGGMIGCLAQATKPGLFRALVLVGASARYLDDSAYKGGFGQADVDGIIQAMQQDYIAWASGFGELAMANPDRPYLAREFTRSLLAMEPDIAWRMIRTIFTSDHRRDVTRVLCPTLLLQTAQDAAVPLSAAQWLADAMPETRLEVIEAEGHFPHISAPDAVNNAIARFLATVG